MTEDFAAIERSYSMGEVVRETGVPAATLRAWERRYGVPRPERTSGRHRLYSEREITLIRWLVSLHQKGIAISRAIAAWRQSAGRGQEAATRREGAGSTLVRRGDSLEELRLAWIAACLAYDRGLAGSSLGRAYSLYPLEDVCRELIQCGMSEIGEAWHRGETSVQQEHFASTMAAHQIERLIAAAPEPWRRGRLLVACPPQEQHALGLLLLTLLLRRRGWDTLYLGANVPIDRLEVMVSATRPTVAVLAAQRAATAATLAEMALRLQKLGIPVGYGGLVYNLEPFRRSGVPGTFLGEGIGDAPPVLEKMAALAPPGTVV